MNAGLDRRSAVGIVAAAALASCVHWPRRSTIRRIGFLVGAYNPGLIRAFFDQLARLGWVQGQTIQVEMRAARPNSNDAQLYAAELVRLDLELIVASALPQALEVRRVAPSLPMVIGTGAGLVSNGFARTLQHPAGNTTGMEELVPGLTAKRLALLKAAAPYVGRVALLSTTPGMGGHEIQLADAIAAASSLRLAVKPYRAATVTEIGQALLQAIRDGMEGLVSFQGGLSLANRHMIVDFAAEHRLPAIYQAVLFAEVGGLMSWAPDQNDQLRTAARLTDRILRGAKPGDLPITYPSPYFLTLNLTAARRIGLSFPEELIGQAHRVIG